ncbi:PREDICTED: zinc finger MYM-type protein 4-like isoform X2 [Poecilia mexicana]|uniref:zinc finger MYM-type protein 4-like isoform X2 n=1 Tax=Poecilia mexicana TaxID=48701 RepID=UPI00072DF3EC|nr:PREDICTED: zinc finger MYM-type protein 4-like isoform X2 [Poecilia mexicana]
MAESEEFRLKRLKRDEEMSRMFDEVMGLGEFADSSRGSVGSSKSGGQPESKGLDETLEQGESQPLEEDSNSSRQEKKTDEGTGETSFPPLTSTSSEKPSSFNMVRSERGGGGSGGAAFDDALDGLPSYGPEEEDEEDWHYALPMGSLEDVDVGKASKISQLGQNSASQSNPFDQKPEAEEEEQENERSTESANTSHSYQDNTLEHDKGDGGLNQTEETEDSQQEETSGNTQGEDRNPPPSPRINIKDEPIDEGYDAALLPQNSTKQIKEEREQEEELRISSVFSVGGGNTFTTSAMPPAVPAPTTTHILIPGRGAVLQAVASLPVRPAVSIPTPLPTLTAFPPRPPPPAVPGSVRCSGCAKVLLKGQTAFQRKGSTQLFCSTVCLTGHLPPITKGRACFQCNREILQPRDMVTVPAENSTFMHFCGQFCLSVYRHKKKQGEKLIIDKRPERKPEKPPEKPVERPAEKPFCGVCKSTNKIEHEVTYQGKLHRLCSDNCFLTWRKLRQLALNCCEGCGLYCSSKSGSCHMLTIEKSQLNFCSSTCIGTFKQSCRKTTECANCHKTTVVSSTIMERDHKGKVQLYCSPTCVEQSRPPNHSLTGTPFPCGLCKVSAVPQYHLAMVDGTIRSFCSLACVTTFRKSPPTSQPDLTNGTSSLRDLPSKDAPKSGPSTAANGATGATSVPPIPQDYSSSVPYPGHHPSYTSVPPLVPPHSAVSTPSLPGQAHARSPLEQPVKPLEDGLSDAIALTCYQCNKQFSNKPLLITHQGRILLLCSKSCCDQYNTQKNVLSVCDYCKEEKVLYEVTSFGHQDVCFCSEYCKQFFKQEHALRPCSYCCGLGQKMMLSHYGGKIEEFCKPHCMSQYTVLYYGMGRCDSCRKQGYMSEKLQCLGSVCNFCNMACLLQYCCLHFEASQHTSNGMASAPPVPSAPAQPHHPSKMNPVIADVVSLANGSASQPNGSAGTALTGELPTSSIDGKNLDHASTQTDAMRAPAPRRRQMKNKSVLCRPFTMDQEIMCQLPSPSPEPEAGDREENIKVFMVPVPVPVFVPVPMNMYSQHTPVAMVVPMPIPVPIVVKPQTKDVKDAAVQMEKLDEEEEEKEKKSSSIDQCSSSHSGDVKTEVVSPTKQNEEMAHIAAQTDLLPTESSERSTEGPDHETDDQPETGTGVISHPPSSSKDQPPSSPVMDLEADLQPGLLNQNSSVQQRGVKRRREGSYGRKRGRRRTGSADQSVSGTPASSKLNHLYGVKAWTSWVQQSNKQPTESSRVAFKEDIVQCSPAELGFALSRFIREVRRPNGEPYGPDSIFYLCLGIQQHLFLRGRIENIFTDEVYSQFGSELSRMLRLWKPKLQPSGTSLKVKLSAGHLNSVRTQVFPRFSPTFPFPPSGGIVPSRIEESYLWECKQLGAYSPIVLLNTLLFFCTKHLHLTTLAEHQRLSFSNFTRRFKPHSAAGNVYLQYERSGTGTSGSEQKEHQEGSNGEMWENAANPLQCPVRLYEFYLSRCPESVKIQSSVFYLRPQRNVHACRSGSSHWYSSQPLDGSTLQSMLTRILAVREVQQEHGRSAAAEGLSPTSV